MVPLTLLFILALVAFILVILSILTPPRVPLWVAVLVLTIIELLRTIPLGR